MTGKYRYPMEAFALAAVLCTTGMKTAMLVGIGLVFGDVLQYVLREFHNTKYAGTVAAAGAALTCGAIYLMCILSGITPGVREIIGYAVMALLLMKHQESWQASQGGEVKCVDYSAILTADAWAYAGVVFLAIIREYLAGATIFGYALPELPVISSTIGKPMFALVGAGLLIAALNRILKAESRDQAGLWVCIPVIVLEVPFVWNHVSDLPGMAIGVFTVGVIYLSLRKKLVFSDAQKHIEGLPLELVMLGIVYMIFNML